MLHQVRESLLIFALVHGADVHFQVGLEASAGHAVGQQAVPQPVGQCATTQQRVLRQRVSQQLGLLRWLGRAGGWRSRCDQWRL